MVLSSPEFLKVTSPEQVYISSGRHNMYHHPSKETIKLLKEKNVSYKDTQEDGLIVVK